MLANFNEKPKNSLIRIARFILERGETSKSEIASALNLSMPTTLQCVKELIARNIVHEIGEYESTGGRKAKALSIVDDIHFSIGVEITANHLTFVVTNMLSEIIFSKRIRFVFHYTSHYFSEFQKKLTQFITDSGIPESKILGIGFSIPGIVISEQNKLVISHVLQLEDVDLGKLVRNLPYPTCFENDANSAAIAEMRYLHKNMIYLSLSNSVGGAIYYNGNPHYGDNYRSGEFGHMLIEPNGKACYCGKKGCVDAYCSARILANYTNKNLAKFFIKVEQQDEGALAIWNDYLEHLAITVSNIRLTFDCDIILGGYVGCYIEPYLPQLWHRLQKYDIFDQNSSFLHPCHFKNASACVGISMHFINQFISNIQ